MNIKNELQKSISELLFKSFKKEDFIHIAECLNLEKDLKKRRTALDKYIEIVINEAGKIEKPHQLSRSIYTANKYLLRTYKNKKGGKNE